MILWPSPAMTIAHYCTTDEENANISLQSYSTPKVQNKIRLPANEPNARLLSNKRVSFKDYFCKLQGYYLSPSHLTVQQRCNVLESEAFWTLVLVSQVFQSLVRIKRQGILTNFAIVQKPPSQVRVLMYRMVLA